MTQNKRNPEGIRVRQANGKPVYEAWVFDKDATYINKKTGELVRGRKIYATFGNLSEAKSWRRDAGRAVERGELKAGGKLTLKEAANEWLAGAESGEITSRKGERFKPSTLRTYRHDLEAFILPRFAARKLSDIKPDDLEALIRKLRASGLSGSKVRNIIVPLQAIYRHWRRQVPVNPTVGLDLPRPSSPRDRAASPEEAIRLIDALPEEDRTLWAVAFFGGLRRGEIRGLEDQDVDLDGNLIHVRRGWDDKEGAVDPKSRKGERVVPIPSILRRYLLEQRARTGRRGSDLFFGISATEPFGPTSVRRRAIASWTAAAVGGFFQGRNAGLEPLGLHEARHTYVSLMHAAGVPLERIGDYVGHGSSYMTDRYRHLIEGQRDEDAARLDAFLSRA